MGKFYIEALDRFAREVGVPTFELYVKMTELTDGPDVFVKPEDLMPEATAPKKRSGGKRKPINRHDRQYITKDKAKAGRSKWHHHDKITMSQRIKWGDTFIQDKKRDEIASQKASDIDGAFGINISELVEEALEHTPPYIHRTSDDFVRAVTCRIDDEILACLTKDEWDFIYKTAQDKYAEWTEAKDALLDQEAEAIYKIRLLWDEEDDIRDNLDHLMETTWGEDTKWAVARDALLEQEGRLVTKIRSLWKKVDGIREELATLGVF